MTAKMLVNHKGGVGEIGRQVVEPHVVNHSVVQSGTIGHTLVNHALKDAAPTTDQVTKQISEADLANTLGLRPYVSRACSVTGSGDVVQLSDDLKPGWDQISEHFDHVGMKGQYTKRVVWSNSFDVALDSEYKDMPLIPFYFGLNAHEVRPDANRLFVTSMMNNKKHFLNLTRSIGVKIPHSIFFNTKEQISNLSQITFPIVLKIDESVAGLGTVVCKDEYELAYQLFILQSGVPFHLQTYLGENSKFISAQYLLADGKAKYCTSTCNFIVGDSSHDGNWGGDLFPHSPEHVATPIANAIAQMGGKGWLGIDVGLTEDGRMYPIEANLRYTAAAYYFLTAQKLGMHDQLWAGRSYASSKSLSDIDLGDIAYTKKIGHGWILTNWGPMVIGKKEDDGKMKYGGGFLYVGPPNWDLYKKSEDKLREYLA